MPQPSVLPLHLHAMTGFVLTAFLIAGLGLGHWWWMNKTTGRTPWDMRDVLAVYCLCLLVVSWQTYRFQVLARYTEWMLATNVETITTSFETLQADLYARLSSLERRVPKRIPESCKWGPRAGQLTFGGGLGVRRLDEEPCRE